MVPASFTELATIPLTPNGKVDTKQLETYETKPQPVDLKSPVNDWERRILAVWQEVLECSEISTDQTFFDAGGNSLLMMKVASKLKTELGIANCSVTQLFQYPTISALAAHLGSNAEQGQVFSQLRSRAQQRMTARYGKKQ
jgi:linear gramicidin synthetase subunit D